MILEQRLNRNTEETSLQMNGEGGDTKLRLEGCLAVNQQGERINRGNKHVGRSWQERVRAFRGMDRSLFSIA